MKYELPSTELIVIEENNYLKFGEYLNDMQCDDTTNKLCLDDLEYIKKLQQENKQLKMINKEYERLNKEKNRGFKITNVQEYNIDELLSYKKYKDNWNKLKKWVNKHYDYYMENEDYIGGRLCFTDMKNKMQELEGKSNYDK